MNSGPSALLERGVALLIPPLVREEVTGDLWERYRSPSAYLCDALLVVPFVIWRQAIRSSDGALTALLGIAMFAAFGGIARALGEAALAASLSCLAALLLRGAYRSVDAWTGRRAAGDAAAMLGALLAAQMAFALIAPEWRLSLGWAIGGFVFSVLLMLLLRSGLELPNSGARLRMAALADPQDECRALAGNLRLRARLETGVLALLGCTALWFGLTADRLPVSIIAVLWAMPTMSLVALGIGQETWRPISKPAELLAELERQRSQRQSVWWWLAAPLFAGLALEIVLAAGRPVSILAGIAICALLAGLLDRLVRRRRTLLDRKISYLKGLAAT